MTGREKVQARETYERILGRKVEGWEILNELTIEALGAIAERLEKIEAYLGVIGRRES